MGIINISWYWSPWGYVIPFIRFSGEGLDFGKPGARREWRKADVLFEFRDWKYVWDNDYWILEYPEEYDLIDEVDDVLGISSFLQRIESADLIYV